MIRPSLLEGLSIKRAYRGSKCIGNGVFTFLFIPAGTEICVCPTIRLQDAKSIEDYYFVHEGVMLLACGVGSLMNHSRKPNVDYDIVLSHISFIAVRDICGGEELLIDYGAEYWYNRGMESPE